AEAARDLRQAVVADRLRTAIAARVAHRERPAVLGATAPFAEHALAHDGAGADDGEVGLRREPRGRQRAVIAVAASVEQRVGVLRADREDELVHRAPPEIFGSDIGPPLTTPSSRRAPARS